MAIDPGFVQAFVRELRGDEYVVYKVMRYSGRGMMGKLCVGVVCPVDVVVCTLAFRLGIVVCQMSPPMIVPNQLNWHWDNLGHQSIVYCPQLEWPEEVDDEE